jgi:hypothetical protein
MNPTTAPTEGAITIPEAPSRGRWATPEQLDRAVADVAANAQAWIDTPIAERRRLLDQMVRDTLVVAEDWARDAARAKGIEPTSPAWGEDVATGPMQLIRNLRLLDGTLAGLEEHGSVQFPRPPRTENGRVVVPTFPTSVLDRAVYAGHTGETWLLPHITDPSQIRAGQAYRAPGEPRVAFVLGAGNVSSVGAADVLTKLFGENQVCVLKMNPVNEHLGPHIETALQVLQRQGVLRIVYGGIEAGQHLVDHDDVDTIHMTASDKTHDAVVFGPGEEGARNKRERTPRITKEVTSELGNVSPVIVVPGPWSEDDLAYQGKHIATMLVNNAGFNCACPRVLVTHRSWRQRGDLLDALRASLSEAPQRAPYYPGARERWEHFTQAHPEAELFGDAGDGEVPWTLLPELDASRADDIAFRVEAFNGVMGEAPLDAPRDVAAYLDAAVEFCNERLWGTLAATILVHPRSLKDPATAEALERALADLRYGTVAVNTWAATAYGLGSIPWGAYPGHPLHDIQSGRGWVRNTFLLEDVEKSVLRAPWRLGKKPPMSYDFTTFPTMARRLVEVEAHGDWRQLPAIVADGVRA